MRDQRVFSCLIYCALVAFLAAGCGRDDPGSNNGNNGEPDAGGTDAGETDADDPDGGDVPEGSVYFIAPAAGTYHTNGTVEFELGVNDDVEEIELHVDGELLAAIDDGLTYSWSTLDQDEGSYLVRIHFTVGGEDEVSEHERTIVVDRTAPVIEFATPQAFTEVVLAHAPIQVSFSKALDPDSVNTDTVIFTAGDLDIEYTVSLVNGDTAIGVDFDRTLAPGPYGATLVFDGVTDLAGNAVDEDPITWTVPAWLEETGLVDIQNLYDYTIVHADGADYLVTRQGDNGLSKVMVWRGQPSPWTEVADVDLHVLDTHAVGYEDKVYVAILHRVEVFSTFQRRINVYVYDPSDDSFEDIAQIGSVGNDDGTYNGSIAMAFNGDVGIIVSVSNSVLRIHEFPELLFDAGVNTVNAEVYPHALYNNLRAHVDDDDAFHVAFTRCQISQGTCRNNRLQYITKAPGDDDWAPTVTQYHTGAGSQDCNKLTGYDAYLGGSEPVFVASVRSDCSNASNPNLSARHGASLEDVYFPVTNQAVIVPDAVIADRFIPRMVSSGDGFELLLASANHLSLAYAEQGSLEFVRFVDTGLTPNGGDEVYSHANMFRTERGLIVVFRFDGTTYIRRANR